MQLHLVTNNPVLNKMQLYLITNNIVLNKMQLYLIPNNVVPGVCSSDNASSLL